MATRKLISNKVDETVLPYNSDAEEKLLSSILNMTEELPEVISLLKVEDFYLIKHQIVFAAIQNLYNSDHSNPEIIALSEKIKQMGQYQNIGGMPYLVRLSTSTPSSAEYSQYLSIVQKNSILRQLIEATKNISLSAYARGDINQILAQAESRILGIGDSRITKQYKHVSAAAREVLKEYQDIIELKGDNRLFKLGFSKLETIIRGFRPSQLVVVAGRPGGGKTAFAISLICNAIREKRGTKIAFFNLEMSASEVTERIFANLIKINRELIYSTSSRRSANIYSRIAEANAVLENTGLYIDDTAGITHEEIAAKCRRIKRENGGLDLIVVDYLQLIRGQTSKINRQEEVAEISRAMKILAKDMETPVLLLSQLSRSIEKREEDGKQASSFPRPKLSDLRDSGAIEQDADIVMFLSPKDEKRGEQGEDSLQEIKEVMLYIEKHRNGRRGKIKFLFNGKEMTFYTPEDARSITMKSSEDNKIEEVNIIEDSIIEHTDDNIPTEEDIFIPSRDI